MKYKDILKRKGDKDSDGNSTRGKSDQARVVEEADEGSCDVLTTESKKVNIRYLATCSGCTYYMYTKRE